MFQNYLKTTLRQFWRNKINATVNIVGLALGITAFVFILEYVSFEKSYNSFHQNLPVLYRLLTRTVQGKIQTDIAPAVAPLAKQQFPEVQDFCRLAEHSANGIITYTLNKNDRSQQSFREGKLAYADGNFFSMFTFPLVEGNVASALMRPNTVALSQSQAHKYFGKSKAVGRTLTLNNQFGKTLYTVTAVYATMPQHSDLSFDAVFSLETLANPANLNGNKWADLTSFDGSYLTTFLQLSKNTDYGGVESKFNELVKKLNPSDETLFLLQPAATMHLGAALGDSYPTNGSLGLMYLLSGIAGLIVLIAWFNYVNLSTAGALKRAKEVGVRKVTGANSRQLMAQFLGESLLLNLFGFGLAFVLIALLQSVFNGFIKKDLSLRVLLEGGYWLIGLSMLVVGALASGGYVAYTLLSFQPAQTLKGAVKTGKGHWLRQTLVVTQFSASVILVIATLILYRQLDYMQRKDLGVKLDQRVVIGGPSVGDAQSITNRTTALEQELSQLPYVKNFCQTGMVPGEYYNGTTNQVTKQNPRPNDGKQTYSMGVVDDRYLTTYSIELAAGRNFTPREAELGWEKSGKLLVNETAARQLGFGSAKAAAGQTIHWTQDYEIVGVVRDYHHKGLRQVIEPVIFLPSRSASNLTVHLTTDRIHTKMTQLERLYKASYPGNPFEFFFVEERYNKQYQSEQQYGKLFTIASALAIFIACLGLFGLTSFTTEQRIKEIGIRKVLGASVIGIVRLLSQDFLKLVLISIVIASPVAWWAMSWWLRDFAYRVNIEWWVFVVAASLAVGIALLTVSFQSVKAALMNPVKSLRSE